MSTPLDCTRCGQNVVANAEGIPEETIRTAALNHKRYCPAADQPARRQTPPHPAGPTAAAPTATPQPAPPKGPAMPDTQPATPTGRPSADQLLDHPVKAIARQAAKVLAEEARLTDLWTADQENAKIRAEIARTEARLKTLRSKLKGSPTGPDAKTVRAWAAANGVDCPATGKLPLAVTTAYAHAHAGAA